MKRTINNISKAGLLALVVALAITDMAFSQGNAIPLTIQGMNQFNFAGARAQGMGGVLVGSGNDASAIFGNPAALSQMNSGEIRFGASMKSAKFEQHQEWVPNRFYQDLSLLFENLIWHVKDPVVTDPLDKLHKPFDTILPDWNKKTSHFRPGLMAAAMPFELGGMNITAGIGYAEVINLDHYFQNNNSLTPHIGLYRPAPTPIVAVNDSLRVKWFQHIRQRDGAVYGITPALSIKPIKNLSLGISAAILTGSSDDFQMETARGNLTFLNIAGSYKYRLDSVYYKTEIMGTSKYRGVITTLGALYQEQSFALGVSMKPPMTIERRWERTVKFDTTGSSRSRTESGVDKLEMPWNVTIGLALRPTTKWSIGVDYEIRQYESSVLNAASGASTNPWLSSQAFRFGAEYQFNRWLFFRGGYREEVQVFAAEGAGLLNDPVRGSVYTFGVGVNVWVINLDLAYAYTNLTYQDLWQSNVNYNKVRTHSGVAEISYRF